MVDLGHTGVSHNKHHEHKHQYMVPQTLTLKNSKDLDPKNESQVEASPSCWVLRVWSFSEMSYYSLNS